MSPLEETALNNATQFVAWAPDEKSRQACQRLLEKCSSEDTSSESWKELVRWYGKPLRFGTAGLRAMMRDGINALNPLVIQQTTQGLCNYLVEEYGKEKCKTQGILIGYDNRHNSKEYAEIATCVCVMNQIRVRYLEQHQVPTPFVAFGVRHFSCLAGIMITASHNPKQYNGYKLYGSNGAQIIPPVDEKVASWIERSRQPQTFEKDICLASSLVEDPCTELVQAYYQRITECIYTTNTLEEYPVKCVYTAMHGVGYEWVMRAFRVFELPPVIPVQEQMAPDPEFPTVEFPNPEEGKGALRLSIDAARTHCADLILATDPDADRLAVAEVVGETVRIFDGNEIAALLLDWTWQNTKQKVEALEANDYFVATTAVSSKFMETFAEKEGLSYVETLTGFKWIANAALLHPGTFLFAYEVEIGFMVGDCTYDKDGIRTAAVFAEMANWLRVIHNRSCEQHLQVLRERYGYFAMEASYFFCDTREKLDKVFEYIRKGGTDGTYIQQAGEFQVESIRDVTLGTDQAESDGKSKLPLTPNDHMITFRFNNRATCTFRNSGTEPKLKWYLETHSSTDQAAKDLLKSMKSVILETFLNPTKFGLQPPVSG